MDSFLSSYGIVVFGLVILILWLIKVKSPRGKYTIANYSKRDLKSYRLGKSILTGPELIFYRELRKNLQNDYIIGTKIRLADFIYIKSGAKNYGSSTTPEFNRISSKHADFTICSLNGKPLAWIELDDKSHATASARKADRFKNDVAEMIGIPLYRVKTGTNYNDQISAIKMAIR